MATPESPASVKNRWTRWYMWFLYSVAGFLIFIIIIALAVPGEPANVTPEERMARLEATQTAELVEATREASEQQTKEVSEHFEEQTKEAEDLHQQQTKEAEDNPAPDEDYCEEISTLTASIGTAGVAILNLVGSGSADEHTANSIWISMATLDSTAEQIKGIDPPKSAEKLHRKAEDMADNVLDITDDIRKKVHSSNSESFILAVARLSKETPEYLDDYIEEYGDYCDG